MLPVEFWHTLELAVTVALGDGLTVKAAAAVVAVLHKLLKTARYCLPLSVRPAVKV